MRLYDWKSAPNPRRVRIFAAEKGIELELVDVGEGATLKRDFLSRSDHRVVPMLELDDGTLIGEALAICRTLEVLHPERPLLGTTAAEVGTIHMWEHVCELEGVVGAAEVLRNAVPAFADRGLPGHPDAIPQIPALIERGKMRVAALRRRLDARLADDEFVAGDRFTMADITALCAVDFGVTCRIPIPDGLPNLSRWHAAVSARPSATRWPSCASSTSRDCLNLTPWLS